MTNYYEQHAQEFIDNTLSVDMSAIYEPFIKKLPKNATILDVGCGSGRDLLYFKKSGYYPIGLEPSKALAEHARGYSGVSVIEKTIESFESEIKFDAIWACASILHVPSAELLAVFRKMSELLNQSGTMYISFKHGTFEGVTNKRFFNFQTMDTIEQHISSSLMIEKHWISSDVRNDKKNEWLNLLLIKQGK